MSAPIISDPPFFILSDGQERLLSTHDTSRACFHHQDLAAFSEDVNSAAKRAFPNRGRCRYDTVNVCLIRWEDDELGVQQEFNALESVFRDYGFQTNVFLIPKLNSHWDLMRKTLDFIQACDNDRNLFVLYYAGHGRINSARQAEWIFGQEPNSPFVDWSAIQGLFGTAKSDVLILLDTCAAASSATTSQFAVMETIAACGFERRAPPPGEHSLTNTLIDVLRDWMNKPSFSAASLHTEILFRLKLKERKKGRGGMALEWCVTPVHWINTKDHKATGIEICRRDALPSQSLAPRGEAQVEENPSTFVDAMDIDFDDTRSNLTPLSSISSSGSYNVPHVLISLQLEENQPLDSKECARWLGQFPLLAKWVKVEAVFPSYSTLMMLSVPMPIWDMLPDYPACSFVGYVTGPRLGGLSASEEIPAPDLSTAKETSREALDTILGGDAALGRLSLPRKAGELKEPDLRYAAQNLPSDKRDLLDRSTQQHNRFIGYLGLQKEPSSYSSSLKRQRPHRPKVKTGCINCKLRRVKCDETKPECYKCIRSGRYCDGYALYRSSVEVPIQIAPRLGSSTGLNSMVIQYASPVSVTFSSSTPAARPKSIKFKKRRLQLIRLVSYYRSALSSPTIYHPQSLSFSLQDGQYFEVFRMHIEDDISSLFDSEFWTRIVLQESHSQLSIRHTTIALGALYKTLETTSQSRSRSENEFSKNSMINTASYHFKYALKQYGIALRRLRDSLEHESRDIRSYRIILMSIVLFTCFQSFSGDYKAGISQIKHGILLLEERRAASKQIFARGREVVIEDELVRVFYRLVIQAKSFEETFCVRSPYVVRLSSGSEPSLEPSSGFPDVSMDSVFSTLCANSSWSNVSTFSNASMVPQKRAETPRVFATVQEARSALDHLRRRNQELSAYNWGPYDVLPSSIRIPTAVFHSELRQWSFLFEPLLNVRGRLGSGSSRAEHSTINVLKMTHLMTTIHSLTRFSDLETQYDSFLPEFSEIIKLAQEIVDPEEFSSEREAPVGELADYKFHQRRLVTSPTSKTWGRSVSQGVSHGVAKRYSYNKPLPPSYAVDLGVVAPLYLVATKCRDRRLRRDAINMLFYSPRREGMWDGILCGRIGERIMKIEEQGLSEFKSWDRSASEVVPGFKRVTVREVLFDLQTRVAVVRFWGKGAREEFHHTDDSVREIRIVW